MFSIPGILLLVAFVYLRPQEYFTALQAVPLLYLFFALALFGVAVDWRQRHARPATTPQLPWVLGFFAWCVGTLVVRDPSSLVHFATDLGISVTLYLMVAHGLQSFRALSWLMGLLLAITVGLAFVGVHQGLAPMGCHKLSDYETDTSMGVYDGRSCATRWDCEHDDPEPGADYLCEHVGLMGTHSIGGGRVRYRGSLQDPNELALAIGIGVPIAFALFSLRRSGTRTALLVLTLVLVAWCTVLTQSRGGQLVFLTAVGVYFVRRFGWRGIALGVVLAAPLFLLGGRSGAEAEASSLERLECWYEGMSMWKSSPILGVGAGQFLDHHFLTAHNSYVLAPAELGLPGMLLFSMVLYTSLKIPVAALRRVGPDGDPKARAWAVALIGSLAGLFVGIFFLSFCYHQVLWIWFGVAGAYYLAVQRHDPGFVVKVSWGEVLWVLAADLGLIATLFVYTRLKV